ncbi:MAG: hypothetical protein ACRDD8_06180 [Bacteroidales bacterium]
MTKIKRAVAKAHKLANDAEIQISVVFKMMVFSDDFDTTPNVSMCHGGELIVEYMGSEIFIEEAIDIMSKRGYIKPSDFPKIY